MAVTSSGDSVTLGTFSKYTADSPELMSPELKSPLLPKSAHGECRIANMFHCGGQDVEELHADPGSYTTHSFKFSTKYDNVLFPYLVNMLRLSMCCSHT